MRACNCTSECLSVLQDLLRFICAASARVTGFGVPLRDTGFAAFYLRSECARKRFWSASRCYRICCVLFAERVPCPQPGQTCSEACFLLTVINETHPNLPNLLPWEPSDGAKHPSHWSKLKNRRVVPNWGIKHGFSK